MSSSVPRVTLNSGYKIPQLGLGTWLSKPGEVAQAVRDALHVGYRHIDCAQAYQNQAEIGSVLTELLHGKIHREDLFVTSKIWNTFHSYENCLKAVDMILADLHLDYLDLCLIHWPQGYDELHGLFPKDENGKIMNSDVDYLDTWRALEKAVDEEKIRSIGLSNFNRKQIERILNNAKIRPAVLQVEIHPYFPQWELVEFCKARGIQITAFSPLANPGHMFRVEGQPQLLEEPLLQKIAKRYDKTPAQVAIRWSIQRGFIVIPKSVSKHRIHENFQVFDFELNEEEMGHIGQLERNLRFLTLDRDIQHPHYSFEDVIAAKKV